jgi:hypothetical protein
MSSWTAIHWCLFCALTGGNPKQHQAAAEIDVDVDWKTAEISEFLRRIINFQAGGLLNGTPKSSDLGFDRETSGDLNRVPLFVESSMVGL